MLNASSLMAMTSTVKEVINTKSVLLSIVTAFVGVGIIILSSFLEDKSSSVYMAGNTLAIVLIILGLYRLFFKRKQLVYFPTKSTLISGSAYFDTKHLEELKAAIETNQETNLSDYEFTNSGNSRLDYMVSKDGQFVAVQLYQYVPYTFEPVCEVASFEASQAANFGTYLLANHGKF